MWSVSPSKTENYGINTLINFIMKKLHLLKTVFLLCALVVGSNAWAATAGFTPSSALSTATGSVTGLADETWTYSITFDESGSYYGFGAAYGWQLGAGQKDGKNRGCRGFSISTSGITGTITKIEVEAGSYNGNSKINVTVGGAAFGTQNQNTNSGQGAAKSTFTGSASGEIVISATDAVRAFYLKSVVVTYSTGASVSEPTFSPAGGAVNAGSTVSLVHTDADAIRYTTDGADPTKTTGTLYNGPITITTATTIKAIAIKGDDVSSVASAAYTINVTSPTFDLASGYFLNGIKVALTSAGNTIYYTTNGSNPSNTSTEYTEPVTINGDMTIKAIAYDPYGNASSVVSRTYHGKAPAVLPFNWAGGGKATLTALTGVIGNNLGSDYDSASHGVYQVKFDDTNDYIEIFTDEKPVKVSMSVKMIGGAATSHIKVQESTNGVEFTDVDNLDISGSQYDIVNLETTQSFASTTRVIKLLFQKGSNVGVGPIVISSSVSEPSDPVVSGTTITLATTANMAGWRAFYDASQDYEVDANTKIYVAKAKSETEGEVELTALSATEIPHGEAVILKTSAPSHEMQLTETTGAATLGANLLAVTDGTNNVDGYRLGYGEIGGSDAVGFFKYTTTTAPAAGIVYIDKNDVNITSGARGLSISFTDDETTGVNELKAQKVDNLYFNLAGQRVTQPTKGLYIVNGKKVIVK